MHVKFNVDVNLYSAQMHIEFIYVFALNCAPKCNKNNLIKHLYSGANGTKKSIEQRNETEPNHNCDVM